jgi:glycosyltransferase involved in cell wall biosynthesis
MKLLAIAADIDSNNLGGAEWHFVEVLKRIAPKFEMITVIVGPETNIKERLKDNPNVEIIPIKYPHITNFYGLFFTLFSLPRIFSILKKEHYDLIWAKQEYPQGVVAGILKIVTGLPIYLTCQSARLHKDELVINAPLPNWVKSLLADLAVPFLWFSFSMANAVGAVSSFSALNAKKMGAHRTMVIPNGVDLNKFRFRNRTPLKEIVLVTTSSLIYRNGIDTIIKACAQLPKKNNWRLDIAGDGPLKNDLIKLSSDLKISSHVRFLGRVQNNLIPKLLSESDIFLRPSRAEGFGSSFIEAMAIGLPVIATPVGGIVDFLSDHKTGLLVPPNDEIALAKAIGTLIDNEKLVRFLRVNARQLVEKEYNWEVVSQKVFAALKAAGK